VAEVAITKLMHMKECSRGWEKAKHLKNALAYVKNPEKTKELALVRGYHCSVERTFEEMIETKRFFRKGGWTPGLSLCHGLCKG